MKHQINRHVRLFFFFWVLLSCIVDFRQEEGCAIGTVASRCAPLPLKAIVHPFCAFTLSFFSLYQIQNTACYDIRAPSPFPGPSCRSRGSKKTRRRERVHIDAAGLSFVCGGGRKGCLCWCCSLLLRVTAAQREILGPIEGSRGGEKYEEEAGCSNPSLSRIPSLLTLLYPLPPPPPSTGPERR